MKVAVDDPRLDPGNPMRYVDFQDPVPSREVDDHTARSRNGLSVQRCPASSSDQRYAVGPTPPYGAHDVRFVRREYGCNGAPDEMGPVALKPSECVRRRDDAAREGLRKFVKDVLRHDRVGS